MKKIEFETFRNLENNYNLNQLRKDEPKEVLIERLEATVFDFNERIIIDSGFGYEIGYFLGEGNSSETWLIDVRTGLIVGPCSYSKSEVFKYTKELINKLTAKYGYEKCFSELF